MQARSAFLTSCFHSSAHSRMWVVSMASLSSLLSRSRPLRAEDIEETLHKSTDDV